MVMGHDHSVAVTSASQHVCGLVLGWWLHDGDDGDIRSFSPRLLGLYCDAPFSLPWVFPVDSHLWGGDSLSLWL